MTINDVRIDYTGPSFGSNGSPTTGQRYLVEFISAGSPQEVFVTIGSLQTTLFQAQGLSTKEISNLVAQAIRDRVNKLAYTDSLETEMAFDDSIFLPFLKKLENTEKEHGQGKI